mmetsp:Transcript_25710/g.50333  ORF Transcript_25710/g.50333 Transcript_25710/m.50333 type:complete len:189 (-) Transcript_25710:448-1014(-)
MLFSFFSFSRLLSTFCFPAPPPSSTKTTVETAKTRQRGIKKKRRRAEEIIDRGRREGEKWSVESWEVHRSSIHISTVHQFKVTREGIRQTEGYRTTDKSSTEIQDERGGQSLCLIPPLLPVALILPLTSCPPTPMYQNKVQRTKMYKDNFLLKQPFKLHRALLSLFSFFVHVSYDHKGVQRSQLKEAN